MDSAKTAFNPDDLKLSKQDVLEQFEKMEKRMKKSYRFQKSMLKIEFLQNVQHNSSKSNAYYQRSYHLDYQNKSLL